MARTTTPANAVGEDGASAPGVDVLYQGIRTVLEQARASAYRAVNSAMVQAYWQVGCLIVEHEQGGESRAAYGEAVLADLSQRLTTEFGRGFDVRNLRFMRQFFQAFPNRTIGEQPLHDQIRNAVRTESGPGEIPNAPRSEPAPDQIRYALRSESHEAQGKAVRNALRTESAASEICHALRDESPPAGGPSLRPELSWTHYRLLLGVSEPQAREWYMNEAAEQRWSTRQLERQISVLYYERLLSSREKAPVREEAEEKVAALPLEQFIRDPYVLDFLHLQEYPALRESVLEQAIITNLQAFLLELGKGFSFVARQKRVRLEDEDFYIDLVFYNYILKCFVLIDLKIGKLTHQDIGQMDTYVRVFDAHERPEGDNPTIGLILCSTKNEAMARYSVLAEGKQIFAAKYLPYLPSEEELKRQVLRERRLIESRHADREER